MNHHHRILIVAADRFAPQRLAAIAEGHEPTIDMIELAKAWKADLLTFADLGPEARGGIRDCFRLSRRAHALSSDYDLVFLTGEDLAIPYAALQCLRPTRARIVAIGHYLNPGKKAALLRHGVLGGAIDKLVLYSPVQHLFASERLRFPAEKLELIPFHADTHFYCPTPERRRDRDLVVAAGFEHRDYATLFKAVEAAGCRLELGVGSPWSRFRRPLPPLPRRAENRYRTREELRELYRQAIAVVVPLVPTDFQAGISVALEAMACGAPLLLSRTAGLQHLLRHGVDGLYVEPGDAQGMAAAIQRLQTAPHAATQLGMEARHRVAGLMSTHHFIDRLTWIASAAMARKPRPQFYIIPSHLAAGKEVPA